MDHCNMANYSEIAHELKTSFCMFSRTKRYSLKGSGYDEIFNCISLDNVFEGTYLGGYSWNKGRIYQIYIPQTFLSLLLNKIKREKHRHVLFNTRKPCFKANKRDIFFTWGWQDWECWKFKLLTVSHFCIFFNEPGEIICRHFRKKFEI